MTAQSEKEMEKDNVVYPDSDGGGFVSGSRRWWCPKEVVHDGSSGKGGSWLIKVVVRIGMAAVAVSGP
ncbi:hypothetical protein L1987_20475 [Smallanthus sonchifolius]|uniref:Uncharacterized protein n=1 Tax=Smallanthus sonchifolius TaxID=185202 RepID=A0ACB9IUV2_9ASTR|nr:hypothetical protein L1987_20475 [Smallanthus sonchifolius]